MVEGDVDNFVMRLAELNSKTSIILSCDSDYYIPNFSNPVFCNFTWARYQEKYMHWRNLFDTPQRFQRYKTADKFYFLLFSNQKFAKHHGINKEDLVTLPMIYGNDYVEPSEDANLQPNVVFETGQWKKYLHATKHHSAVNGGETLGFNM